jgi:hypothetical protein
LRRTFMEPHPGGVHSQGTRANRCGVAIDSDICGLKVEVKIPRQDCETFESPRNCEDLAPWGRLSQVTA